MQTRGIDASLEGGILSPDGVYGNLNVQVAHGDNVNRVSKAIIQLNNSNGKSYKLPMGQRRCL